jgi:hypothetical protein
MDTPAALTWRPGRPDPDDVLLLLGFQWRVGPGDDAQARGARLLGRVIDGLRAGGPAGLR